jgi:hypothetical protein
MIQGMTFFTAIHVLLSLIGIVSGLVMLFGMRTGNLMNGWTLIFVITTLSTSVTGFLFPFHQFTPAIALGILSTFVLAVAIAARYFFHIARAWRWIYVVSVVAALYFNSFVLIVQAFLKVPALHTLAPTGTEPAFAVAQGAVLLFFVVAGFTDVRGFHPRVSA